MSAENRIATCVRLRPFISEDRIEDFTGKYATDESCVEVGKDKATVKLLRDNLSVFDKPKCFSFDRVFDVTCTQVEVYRESFKILVDSVFEGYNGTGFVYGQTGTGKTFTMFGSETLLGVAHIAIGDIFDIVQSRKERNGLKSQISISFIQVYVEQVYDLLTNDTKQMPRSLNIHEDAKRGTHVENLRIIPVASKEECHAVVSHGLSNRRVRSTEYNMKSSRSHVILQLHLDLEIDTSSSRSTSYRSQRLTFVDLAGAERPNNYRINSKQHFKEAVIINKSISALGNCIKALAALGGQSSHLSSHSEDTVHSTASHHIPFRDCKLTRLLAVPLGGNSKICLIANIGPSAANYEETLSTLKFASRAITVKKTVKKEAVKIAAAFPLIVSPTATASLLSLSPVLTESSSPKRSGQQKQPRQQRLQTSFSGDENEDEDDASQLTSIDENSTAHSSYQASSSFKFSVHDFLKMKKPISSSLSPRIADDSTSIASSSIFSKSQHAFHPKKSASGPVRAPSPCSYTFDDSLIRSIEEERLKGGCSSVDDFGAGIDAMRVYKLKTATQPIRRILRERSGTPNSATIRHKQLGTSPVPLHERGFGKGRQLVNASPLRLQMKEFPHNSTTPEVFQATETSTSRQPATQLISLNSLPNSNSHRRSKSTGGLGLGVGLGSAVRDENRNYDHNFDRFEASSASSRQLFSDDSESLAGSIRRASLPAKEVSLLSFLQSKGNVRSDHNNENPSPSPPPPPPLPKDISPPILPPFSPVNISSSLSSSASSEGIVTLTLPSKGWLEDPVQPTKQEDNKTDTLSAFNIDEGKVNSALEVAKSICKEFEALITQINTNAITSSSTLTTETLPEPQLETLEDNTASNTNSNSTETTSINPEVQNTDLEQGQQKHSGETIAVSSASLEVVEGEINPPVSSEEDNSTRSQSVALLEDVSEEKKMKLLAQLNRNKLVSLVLELQQEVSKKTKEINELQTFILDL